MDRPSVTFGNWGTIGHASPLRDLIRASDIVPISVYAPTSGPAGDVYQPYAAADLENPVFVSAVMAGLRDSNFAAKFIQPKANYGDGLSGEDVLRGLLADPPAMPLTLLEEGDPRRMFKVETLEDRRATLKSIIVEASIQVTSALTVAQEAGASPVADDQHLLKLLSLRTGDPVYLGKQAPGAWLIGLEFAKAVIPEDVLAKIEANDVLEYRRKAADVYEAWTAELNGMAAKLDDLPINELQERISKLLIAELQPRLVSYKAEMASVRDALFADLMKSVIADWKVPTISLASMTWMGFAGALIAFLSTAGPPAAKSVIDYTKARGAAHRKHAVSFLIGASKL
ncbi:hypothetical protein [Bradyrhizobium sp. AUGA SZCCT0222]|uniref:hypothetical protein n=1 Tax=Bradyrhizobium sp. AUGA SZCCT0222 TaxID=2807668 RepID=UPI001BADED5E|nr:hypothetical protein [Bradyrhizobium sp. AUGA SZCCT0222]